MLKKTLGELTGREFHWGLVAQFGAGLLGDIFSNNSAKAAQQQAQENALKLQQQATQQQEAYIRQQEAQQRAIIESVASQGNPFYKAAQQAKPPAPLAIPTAPTSGGQQYGGGSATPVNGPNPLTQAYQQGGQNMLAPQPQGGAPQQNVLSTQPHPQRPQPGFLAPPGGGMMYPMVQPHRAGAQ